MKRAAGAKHPTQDRPRRAPVALADRLTPYFTAALTSLAVLAPLLPFDTAAAQWNNVLPLMLWLVVLVLWAVAGALRGKLEIRCDPATIAVLVLTSLPLVSAVVLTLSGSGNPRYAINLGWQWLGFGVLFFYARQVLKNGADVRALAAMMLAVTVGLSTFSLVQYFYLMPQARAEYQADPEKTLAEAQIHAPPGSPERKHFEDRLASKEPLATFALTNSLAGLLAPWTVLLVALLIVGLTDAKLRTWAAALVLPLLLLLTILYLTKSRTALLAFVAGIGLLLVYLSPLGKRIDWRIPVGLGALMLLALIGGIVSGGLDTEVLSEAPKSVLYRFEYWQATAAMIADYPWLGCGPGNFQDTYLQYQLPSASENIADPHNFVLEIWATAGTFAFLALLVVAGTLVWQVRQHARNDQTSSNNATATPAPLTASFLLQGIAALFGVALAFGIGFIVGLMPSEMLLVSALPVGVLVYVWLRPWVLRGVVTPLMLIAPLVALLVNLLAAGGISFPGVSTSVWLLVAMLLVLVNEQAPATVFQLTKSGAVGVLATTTLLTLAFMFSVYSPVLGSSVLVQQAETAVLSNRFDEALPLVAQATTADPFSSRPWLLQASLIQAQLVHTQDRPALRQELVAAIEQGLARDPRSMGTRLQLGNWYLELYRRWGKAADLASAIQFYRQAIERYPNNAWVHAQLAWALHLSQQDDAAQTAAEQALALDSQHNHKEYKLAERRITDFAPAADLKQLPAASGTAEQVVEQIRTASTP